MYVSRKKHLPLLNVRKSGGGVQEFQTCLQKEYVFMRSLNTKKIDKHNICTLNMYLNRVHYLCTLYMAEDHLKFIMSFLYLLPFIYKTKSTFFTSLLK